MSAHQPPLWLDDWATEPCGDADPGERRQAITGDYGRSPSRGRRWADWARGAETVDVVGGWL
ncbi:hypothetical protein [Streptomyces sp. NPDC002994]|uniref:hypothetical protein n=1 Tax=Streptomyces sp. NPDC002994 TaxID=3154441 RepID=UPI0033A99A43